MSCSQCTRPAIVELGGHALCVEHWATVERLQQDRLLTLQRERSQALLSMAYVAGDTSLAARAFAEMEMARSKVVTNVNVANSVVGAINTGSIKNLTVKMDRLSQGASADLARALKEVTSAVLAAPGLAAPQKNEAASQLELLADQAALPVERRSPGLIKPILAALGVTLSTTADLLGVWNTWGAAIRGFFGF